MLVNTTQSLLSLNKTMKQMHGTYDLTLHALARRFVLVVGVGSKMIGCWKQVGILWHIGQYH